MDFRSSRDSFGSRVALRPCSPLLSDAGTLRRAHSHVGFGDSKFAKTLPEFGFGDSKFGNSKVCFPSSLRERAPGALWQNSRAETRAAELERVLKADLALQAAPAFKAGSELDICADVLESGMREEQFHKDPKIEPDSLQNSEVFTDVLNVTTKLEYLTKRSRLEHLWDRPSGDKAAAKEERRRQEERRIRQEERLRMSRDPRRKVAQKVEDRRRLGDAHIGGKVGVDVNGLTRNKLSGSVENLLQQRRKAEKAHPASEYYEQTEAERYHRVPKAPKVQAELTYSAVALGGLLPQKLGSIVLDLGAGGGLSTLTLQALAAFEKRGELPDAHAVPFVLAFDTSAHMLATAHIQESSLGGIRLRAIREEQVGKSGMVDLSAGLPWVSSRCDRIQVDMSQPLPLRSDVVNAVLSVSAVQWLIQPRTGSSKPSKSDEAQSIQPKQSKLETLFASLKRVAVKDAKLAMQFYPPKGDFDFGARALRDAARKKSWAANVVMDFPHAASAAKKYFLLASCHVSVEPEPWCALSWPVVVARCALQGTCEEDQHGRAQQQHAEVALRLARCGRRLRAACNEQELHVQERLRQQLHPLQIELAKRLDEALSNIVGEPPPESTEVVEAVQLDEAVEPTSKRARNVVNETKTELRSIVASSLPKLLQVLHTPPSEEWLQPTPPLDSTAVTEI
eukprot:Skav213554  [mRNA]  locus=scaffold263:69592:73184:+ [translate_table: standard]